MLAFWTSHFERPFALWNRERLSAFIAFEVDGGGCALLCSVGAVAVLIPVPIPVEEVLELLVLFLPGCDVLREHAEDAIEQERIAQDRADDVRQEYVHTGKHYGDAKAPTRELIRSVSSHHEVIQFFVQVVQEIAHDVLPRSFS